jgi:XTP/dITP diphosphohydrolase
MRLLLATHNAHKLAEIRAILATADLGGVEVVGLDAFPDLPEAPETQATFEGNALQKARFAAVRTGLVCVADDSGLEVDALGGAPGVRSKRFSPQATAEANNALLLERLGDRADRAGRFVCALAVVHGDTTAVTRGTCEGTIARSGRGDGGFGYDPLFLPDAAPGRAMAELSAAEKNAISHRGHAVRQLPQLLAEVGCAPRG